MSGAGLSMRSSEPQVKEMGSGNGVLARDEAACLESGVSGLLGTSGGRLAWGEASVQTALTWSLATAQGAIVALQEAIYFIGLSQCLTHGRLSRAAS